MNYNIIKKKEIILNNKKNKIIVFNENAYENV